MPAFTRQEVYSPKLDWRKDKTQPVVKTEDRLAYRKGGRQMGRWMDDIKGKAYVEKQQQKWTGNEETFHLARHARLL